MPGGDFRTLLHNCSGFSHPVARFYIAEMVMAVHSLHSFGFIHRDLKPENFLVDARGHLKLTDFGLSTGVLNPQAYLHDKGPRALSSDLRNHELLGFPSSTVQKLVCSRKYDREFPFAYPCYAYRLDLSLALLITWHLKF